MTKPIIAVDFDDTLVFNAQIVVGAYNREHHADVTLNDVYVAEKYGNPEHGWHHSREEAREWIRVFLHGEEAQSNPPLPGTKEVLERLKKRYELVIVTGRQPSWRAATEPWLERFVPGIFAAVHYAGNTPKGEICEKIGAEIMIDDSPYYLATCVQHEVRSILFGDYPWNTPEYAQSHHLERAISWAEVEELLLG